MTLSEIDPIVPWLRRTRRSNEIVFDLVAWQFDIDGALDAEQQELVWRGREGLLLAGTELYLLACGLPLQPQRDQIEHTCAMLDLLARCNPPLASRVWELLRTAAPASIEALREQVDVVRAFLEKELSVPAAASCGAAIASWAEGIRVLREMAGAIGLAQDDGWYLHDTELDEQRGWYEEVLEIAELYS
ncbi:hypothetical protein [Streptomyces sp. NBRC 109706]|uniref:hypothetical protein n=1 Tax=Streptomyces sp. NBRC 109706 TaxID=1550035 RepID=UPI0007852808|nr:hypothetical protein [Streptomyces sp. NBRC 109706]